ncbi:hypothetical protein [Microbacterium sp. NPDC076911]|uniref:hypothetical protein n=1 Tax=Microbacterium sp. NPDC076911 TaxID=3154958 RepID=UPI003434D612
MTSPRRSSEVSWSSYRESIGDRSGLFEGLTDTWAIERALYLGSYVDLSPSVAIPAVTYVDVDRRATRFFADEQRVAAELHGRARPGAATEVKYLDADFTAALAVEERSVDLIISLFTGPCWDGCERYLRADGLFLANASHGDASLAALDSRLTLVAAVTHRDGAYRWNTHDLDRYLVPKKPANATAEAIRASGRGVAYTRPAFAYLFRYEPAPAPARD